MGKRNISIFLVTTLLVTLSCISFMIISNHNQTLGVGEHPLNFEDQVFETALKKALNKDSIYQSELNDYVGIVIVANRIFLMSPEMTEKNITLYSGEKFEIDATVYSENGTMLSLADLKHFPSLTSLKVYFQKNLDYNTIRISSTINNLSLYADDISDLTFIGRFINLSYVNLNYNKINDIAPLGSLTKLKTASINFNNISNINGIEKASSLTNLQLNNNNITDISAISTLTNLTSLSLQNNNISNVSCVKYLTNLTNLSIKNNPIANVEELNKLTIIPE